MRTQTFSLVVYGVIVFLLGIGIPSLLPIHAHVNFGEYAGTHAVAFVPQPRSPLEGEEVAMTFYLRDLRGSLASESFIVRAVIQEILENDEERYLFTTKPETITDGRYKVSYRFPKAGIYRIEFSFTSPNEIEVSRDAIFDIEVRSVPFSAPRTALLISMFLIILAFAGGLIMGRRRIAAENNIVSS